MQTYEFGVNIDGLRQEADAAWNGAPYSDEGKDLAARESLEALESTIGADRIITIHLDADE